MKISIDDRKDILKVWESVKVASKIIYRSY